jgi:hypothetical protein
VVEASAMEDMANILYTAQVQRTGDDTGTAVFYGFEPGLYYWRVRPVYPQDFEGRGAPTGTAQSLVASFRVERAEKLAAPQTRERQETIYLEGQERNLYFSWNQENDAEYYTFLLSRQRNLESPIIKEQVRDNYYALDIQNANLANGEYYWGVYQTDIEGNSSPASASQRLVIVAGAPPEQQKPGMAQSAKSAAQTQPAETAAVPQTSPLLAPGLTLPGHEEIFTEERILQDRAIKFSWNAVPGATAYELVIHHVSPQGTQEVFRTTVRNALSYSLSDLTVLDRGQFRWQLRALDGTRRGSPTERVFAVDMGNYEAAEGNESGVIFGN